MYDMKKEISALLSAIEDAEICYICPASYDKLPVISFCEYDNREYERQDGREYLSKIVIRADIYASKADDLPGLSAKVNDAIYTTGLRRCCTKEEYDKDRELFHKSMFFKGIVQPDTGTVYQDYKEEN